MLILKTPCAEGSSRIVCSAQTHPSKNQSKQNPQTEERDLRGTHPSRRCLWVAELSFLMPVSIFQLSLYLFLYEEGMGWLNVESNSSVIFLPPKAVRTLTRKKQSRWSSESQLTLRSRGS